MRVFFVFVFVHLCFTRAAGGSPCGALPQLLVDLCCLTTELRCSSELGLLGAVVQMGVMFLGSTFPRVGVTRCGVPGGPGSVNRNVSGETRRIAVAPAPCCDNEDLLL